MVHASLAGCTTTVTGAAQPQSGRVTIAPAASTDPCSRLTTDEAAERALAAEGTPKPAEPSARIPPAASWQAAHRRPPWNDSLLVLYSTDLAAGDYGPPSGQVQAGGVNWDIYPSPLGNLECDWGCRCRTCRSSR